MTSPALNALLTARTRLLLGHPFFGALAMRLELVEDPSIPTLAVDGRHIFYNPEFVLGMPRAQRVSGMGHEVMHCVLDHITRRGTRDPKRWNQAGDFVINAMLKEAGLEIGPGWLYDKKYDGMSTEEVYNRLPQGTGDALCEIMQVPASASEDSSAEWKCAVVQAAKAAKMQDKLPASLKGLIDELVTSHVPWQDELSAFMNERVKDDYSWARPNKYYAGQAYLPSLDGVGMGEVVIGIDTSGSVADIIEEFGGHVQAICAASKPRCVHVVYCDARVNHVDTFHAGEPIEIKPHGGGGTAFEPVFDWVQKQGVTPACLLYLTDMYGSFPDDPGYPTLWCATSEVTGPFGRTLRIESKQ